MTLLAAVTLDGNNETLPLAWAVVPTENLDHWSWFLGHLVAVLPRLIQHPDMVVLSDRDKGLEGAVAQHLPDAIHGHCCQHLADNIQKRFGLTCRGLFWSAAKATSQLAFNEAMRKIGEEKMDCRTYLEGIPSGRWTCWAFAGYRYGHLTSNMVESMNAEWIRSRELSPLLLLVDLWTRTMQKAFERLHRRQKSSHFTDYLMRELDKEFQESRRYRTAPADDFIAQVFLPSGPSEIVKWQESKCTCLEFQDRGFPCRHAMAMSRDARLSSYDKISLYYRLETYRATYLVALHPIQAEGLSSSDDCAAPVLVATKGRPRKQRIRHDRPSTRTYHCSQCGSPNHTRRSCRPGA